MFGIALYWWILIVIIVYCGIGFVIAFKSIIEYLIKDRELFWLKLVVILMLIIFWLPALILDKSDPCPLR